MERISSLNFRAMIGATIVEGIAQLLFELFLEPICLGIWWLLRWTGVGIVYAITWPWRAEMDESSPEWQKSNWLGGLGLLFWAGVAMVLAYALR